ncbi:MAG TPA: hypothetical protein VGT79_04170 [Xanthomonadaceae bacterium]|nr:hypothetical protein [Xanthomonadaceae bacterium]
MTPQHARRHGPKAPSTRASARSLLPVCAWFLCALLAGCTTTDVRVVSDATGAPVKVHGSVVLIDPDIELYEVAAGGMQEPRPQWTEAARRAYPVAVRELLAAHGSTLLPDFVPPPALQPGDSSNIDHVRQLLLLNQAVASSIVLHSQPGADLATKNGRFDWTLGPGVSVLRDATHADYALFTYIRDSHGGEHTELASLVDLRNGQIVWFNVLRDEKGDLREAASARATVESLLKQIPL